MTMLIINAGKLLDGTCTGLGWTLGIRRAHDLRQKRYATSILAKFASVVSLSCTKMKLVQAWLLAWTHTACVQCADMILRSSALGKWSFPSCFSVEGRLGSWGKRCNFLFLSLFCTSASLDGVWACRYGASGTGIGLGSSCGRFLVHLCAIVQNVHCVHLASIMSAGQD